MNPSFPDIEIYVKGVDLPSILDWLGHHFDVSNPEHRDGSVHIALALGGRVVDCLVVEKAVKGGFTSIWFKSGQSPWRTDRDCALDAVDHLHCEARCSAGSWSEHEEGPGWLRITPDGESTIDWF